MDLKIARDVAARVWCDPEMSSIIMDVELCEAIAHLVLKAAKQSVQRTALTEYAIKTNCQCNYCKELRGEQ